MSKKLKDRDNQSITDNDGTYLIFEDKYHGNKTKLKTLLDRLSTTYNIAKNQSHFVKAIDSKAASRYIDDTQLKAKEMIQKQHTVYYNVLRRDIRLPEKILNRDPLDNNFQRTLGLIEKRE
jgi:hypothetical protein